MIELADVLVIVGAVTLSTFLGSTAHTALLVFMAKRAERKRGERMMAALLEESRFFEGEKQQSMAAMFRKGMN